MADAELTQIVEETDNPHQPKNYGDNHNAIQNTLDLTLHGDEPIYQIQQEADYRESNDYCDKRHFISPSFNSIVSKRKAYC